MFVTTTEFDRHEMYVQEQWGRDVEFEASLEGWGFSLAGGYSQSTS
jgi:hypothetical protein